VDELARATTIGAPWAALIGLLMAGLYAILWGKLVPRSTLDVLTTQWEARLSESHVREQDWKTVATLASERADVTQSQLGRLMTYAETTDAIIRALPDYPGNAGKGG
jgi:hypothetical protein